MKRTVLTRLVLAVAFVLAAAWLVRNTEWGEVTLPAPLQGEAARNPFYAAQRLVEALDGTSERRQSLGDTSPRSVLVLSNWGWDINRERRRELERWVEGGGRLVVDSTLISGTDAFERWSGVEPVRLDPDDFEASDDEPSFVATFDGCEELLELEYGADGGATEVGYYEGCAFEPTSWLVTTRKLLWALSGTNGLEAARVDVGAGSVTVVDAAPFHYRTLFEGDHGEIFAAAAGLVPGDHVVFMSEDDYASLPELIWQRGSPVVVIALIVVALALWRSAARFGPLVAATQRARRSLGEQVLGTGRFVLRVGGGVALRQAARRALEEAARRRIAGYDALAEDARAAAIGRLANVDGAALKAALDTSGARELRSSLTLLEATRRELISRSQWSKHGKRI
jgi:hypothetical protein